MRVTAEMLTRCDELQGVMLILASAWHLSALEPPDIIFFVVCCNFTLPQQIDSGFAATVR
jgi:hypothetical protein